MKKSVFCQQAQMRKDIIEVFDLQTLHKQTSNDVKLLWAAVKTKGATDDEGQIQEVRERGENKNAVTVDHI